MIDQALSAGDLELDPEGGVKAARVSDLQDDLRSKRDARKLSSLAPEDDSSPQEQVILGWALAGDHNNATLWARFRSALGLQPLQEMPDKLWSSPQRLRIARELDAIFRNQRDVSVLNAQGLLQSYMVRQERGHVGDGLQQLSETSAELVAQAGAFSDNDFAIAVDLLKSNRARVSLRGVVSRVEHGLRADRPVEQVVASLADEMDDVRALVAGRMGATHDFAEAHTIGGNLLERMTRQKTPNMPTGIDAIDIDIQGGVNRNDTGKLYAIGARTGVGKTTVGIAAAMGLVRNGCDTLFLSTELMQHEIDARAFANMAKANGLTTPVWILEGRGSTQEPPQDFDQAHQLWMDQTENGEVGRFMSKALFKASAEQFRDFVHSAKARRPSLAAVFMDHFHSMAASPGGLPRSAEMEQRALTMSAVAKECEVDLFLCCQLNRDAALAKKPTKEHINGTDVIGQLAAAVLLLEFPPKEEGAPFNPGELLVHHDKFRNGQRRNGKAVSMEESGLLSNRELCWVEDVALPFA
ncbi:MAG: DnaB-like helicase C-terminal domain-containing protein [Synechococcus sp.]